MNELTFFNLFLLIYFDFYYLNFEKIEGILITDLNTEKNIINIKNINKFNYDFKYLKFVKTNSFNISMFFL